MPLLIFADERLRYLAALRADDGDRGTLATFVRDVATDTIELVAQRLRAARLDPSGGTLERLTDLAAGAPWTGADADLAAARVAEVLYEELSAQAADVPPRAAEVSVRRLAYPDSPRAGTAGYSAGWAGLNAFGAQITGTSPRSRTTHVERRAAVLLTADQASPRPLALSADDGNIAPVHLRRNAVYPVLTTATRQRIRDWASELLGEALTELADRVEAAASPIPEDERGR